MFAKYTVYSLIIFVYSYNDGMNVSEAQRREYLDHALTLTPEERDKIAVYAEWLPPTVIDAHAHANLPEHLKDIPAKTYYHMMSTFPSYTIEESQVIKRVFHPKTAFRTVRFAHVFKGILHRDANEYILSQAPEGDIPVLYGLPDDEAYTIEMLADPRVQGLKMYYSYVEPTATKIYDIFTQPILEAAEKNRVPIILHTPKVITESAEDVVAMKKDFPDLKVSIAHLGSSKFDLPELQDAFEMLADATDVSMDTALNPSAEVCLRALRTFGSKRIMFGTDEPLHLLRSVPYIHPEHGQRITTSYRYHWQDPQEYNEFTHLAQTAVHSHWLCLDALKAAVQAFPQSEQESVKQSVFYDNANAFFTKN